MDDEGNAEDKGEQINNKKLENLSEEKGRGPILQKIVCQKCGDIGYEEALVYCSKCHASAEHRYCLDEVLEDPCQDVEWSCLQCAMMMSSRQVGARSLLWHGQKKEENLSHGKTKFVSDLLVRKPSQRRRTFFVGKKPLRYQYLQTTCTSKAKVNLDVVRDDINSAPQPVISNFETHDLGYFKKELQTDIDDNVGPSGCTADDLGLQCDDGGDSEASATMVKADFVSSQRSNSNLEIHDVIRDDKLVQNTVVNQALLAVGCTSTVLDMQPDDLNSQSSYSLPSREQKGTKLLVKETKDENVQLTIEKDGKENISSSIQFSSYQLGGSKFGPSSDTPCIMAGEKAYSSARKHTIVESPGARIILGNKESGNDVELSSNTSHGDEALVHIFTANNGPKSNKMADRNNSDIPSCGEKVTLGNKESGEEVKSSINHNHGDKAWVDLFTVNNAPNCELEAVAVRNFSDLRSDHSCGHLHSKPSFEVSPRVSGDGDEVCDTGHHHSHDIHGNDFSTATSIQEPGYLHSNNAVLDSTCDNDQRKVVNCQGARSVSDDEHCDGNLDVKSLHDSGDDIADNGNLQVARSLKSSSGKYHPNSFAISASESVGSDYGSSNFVLNVQSEPLMSETRKTTETCSSQGKLLHFVPTKDFQWTVMPLVEPIWSGSFDICNEIYGSIMGHLSMTACERACDAARSLPKSLFLEQKSRLDIWPNSFKRSPPREDNIALFFFPGTNCISQKYADLLNEVTSEDLSLRARLDDSELLIFSSIQLPASYQSSHGNMYLWGVFRGRENPVTSSSAIWSSKREVTKELEAVNLGEPNEKTVVNGNFVHQLQEGIVSSGNDLSTQMITVQSKTDEVAKSTQLVLGALERPEGTTAHSVGYGYGDGKHTSLLATRLVSLSPCAPADTGLLALVKSFCTDMNSDGFRSCITSSRSAVRCVQPHLSQLLMNCIDPSRFVLDVISKDNHLNPIGIGAKGHERICLLLLYSLLSAMENSKLVSPESFVTPSVKERARVVADSWKEIVLQKWYKKSTSHTPYAFAFLMLVAIFGILDDAERSLYEKIVTNEYFREGMQKIAVLLALEREFIEGLIEGLITRGRELYALDFIYEIGLLEEFPPVPLLRSYVSRNQLLDPGKAVKKRDLVALRTVVMKISQFKLESEFTLNDLMVRVGQLEEQFDEPMKVVRNNSLEQKQVFQTNPDPRWSWNNGIYHITASVKGKPFSSPSTGYKCETSTGLTPKSGNHLNVAMGAKRQVKSASCIKGEREKNLPVYLKEMQSKHCRVSDKDENVGSVNHALNPGTIHSKTVEFDWSTQLEVNSLKQQEGLIAHAVGFSDSKHIESSNATGPICSRSCSAADASLLILVKSFCADMDSDGFWNCISPSRSEVELIWPHMPQFLMNCVNPPGFVLDVLSKINFLNPARPEACEGICLRLLDSLHSAMESSTLVSPGSFLLPRMKERARAIADSWKQNVFSKWSKQNLRIPYAATFLMLVATFGVFDDAERPLYENLVMAQSLRKFMHKTVPKTAVLLGLGRDFARSLIQKLVRSGLELSALDFVCEFSLLKDFPPVSLLRSFMTKRGLLYPRRSTIRKSARRRKLMTLQALVKKISQLKLESEFRVNDLMSRIQQLEKQMAEPMKISSNAENNQVVQTKPDTGWGLNIDIHHIIASVRHNDITVVDESQSHSSICPVLSQSGTQFADCRETNQCPATVPSYSQEQLSKGVLGANSSMKDGMPASSSSVDDQPKGKMDFSKTKAGNELSIDLGADKQLKWKTASCIDSESEKNLLVQSKETQSKHPKLSDKDSAGHHASKVVSPFTTKTCNHLMVALGDAEHEKRRASSDFKPSTTKMGDHPTVAPGGTEHVQSSAASVIKDGSKRILPDIPEDVRHSKCLKLSDKGDKGCTGDIVPNPVQPSASTAGCYPIVSQGADEHVKSVSEKSLPVQTKGKYLKHPKLLDGDEKDDMRNPVLKPLCSGTSEAGNHPTIALGADGQVKTASEKNLSSIQPKEKHPRHPDFLDGDEKVDTGNPVSKLLCSSTSEAGDHPTIALGVDGQAKTASEKNLSSIQPKEKHPKHPKLLDGDEKRRPYVHLPPRNSTHHLPWYGYGAGILGSAVYHGYRATSTGMGHLGAAAYGSGQWWSPYGRHRALYPPGYPVYIPGPVHPPYGRYR